MNVEVSTRGSVAPDLAQLAAEKVGALDAAVQRPLTDARVVLLEKQNPRIPRSARAEGDVRMSADAIGMMDALNHRFLYFTDASTGRGAVLYLRYDGHYGLIQPAV